MTLTMAELTGLGQPPGRYGWAEWYQRQTVPEYYGARPANVPRGGIQIRPGEQAATLAWRKALAAEKAAGVRGPASRSSGPRQFQRYQAWEKVARARAQRRAEARQRWKEHNRQQREAAKSRAKSRAEARRKMLEKRHVKDTGSRKREETELERLKKLSDANVSRARKLEVPAGAQRTPIRYRSPGTAGPWASSGTAVSVGLPGGGRVTYGATGQPRQPGVLYDAMGRPVTGVRRGVARVPGAPAAPGAAFTAGSWAGGTNGLAGFG